MHVIINILLPMFAIILLGFIAEKLNLLGNDSVKVINNFVYYLAMPVLIFGSMAIEPIAKISNFKYLAGFTLGMLITFLITLCGYKFWNQKENLATISLKSLGASFPNAGYIGVPLLFSLAGKNGALPAALSSVLAYIIVALTIVLIELDLSKQKTCGLTVIKITFNLSKNPLIISAILGILYSYSDLPFPDAANYFYRLFGGTAAPCALFAIGQTLAHHQLSSIKELSLITSLKLILHPLLTFTILMLFKVNASWIMAGTILSALPTGAVKYMIAQRYHFYEKESSSLILLSTMTSIVTLSILMILLDQLWPNILSEDYQ